MDQEEKKGEGNPPAPPADWKISIPQTKTIRVSNISEQVSERDVFEFFTFSGTIQYIEMQRESDATQLAYVTFREVQEAETAALLTGAVISGLRVSITPDKEYQLPPNAVPIFSEEQSPKTGDSGSVVKKAEETVSTMLARGYALGKDALNRAKSFDQRHQLISNATSTVASIDRRIGLSEKLSIGTTMVNEKVKEMDEKYQVSGITKSALAAAEQKATDAGSAILINPYVSSGASWVTNALSAVSKAAEDVGAMTLEKLAEEQKKEAQQKENVAPAPEQSNEGEKGGAASIPATSADEEHV